MKPPLGFGLSPFFVWAADTGSRCLASHAFYRPNDERSHSAERCVPETDQSTTDADPAEVAEELTISRARNSPSPPFAGSGERVRGGDGRELFVSSFGIVRDARRA